MKTEFQSLAIGAFFWCNGNRCQKKTTRTAVLLRFNRVFYFNKTELVKPE